MMQADTLARPPVPAAAHDRTLHDLDLALVANPGSIELRFLRACTLQGLGREAAARCAYVDLLRRDPDHLGALRNLGSAMAATRHGAAARLLLERATTVHPDDVASRVNLGTLLYQAGELGAARDAFAQALATDPGNAPAHAGMAFVLQDLGDAAGAADHRRRGFAGRSIIELPYRGAGKPVRVLLLASAVGANAPLERFLDDRTFLTAIVVTQFHDAAQPLPAHDLVINAIGDVDADPAALSAAQALLGATRAPVLNPPARIAPTGRCANWQRLGHLPGVVTPVAQTLPRSMLAAPDAAARLGRCGLSFPLLLRTPGFHTGRHFVRVERGADLAGAIAGLPGHELIAMQYLDTRDAQGRTRKYRVMMVDGCLYPLHAAVARDWKVHYFSADMDHDAAHRAEDAAFLADMPGVLGDKAMAALQRIQECLGLDYGGIDFALAPDGSVIVFEANASMVVYQPERDPRWDYRRAAVGRIEAAVRRMLLQRAGMCAPSAAPAPVALATKAPAVPSMDAPEPARALPARPARAPLARNECNFSAGPGALPAEVLQQAQQAIMALPETGLSVLGMSHRSAWFEELMAEAEANLRALLDIPPSHEVVFLQGGSSLQFSMIPMNFAPAGTGAPAHIRSGYWSAKAIGEAGCVRPLHVAWDGAGAGFRCLPADTELAVAPGAPYLHYVSNETVEGVQFSHPPALRGLPLIADMSSDFLSRPIDFARHAMVYAHAQKNLGPAGVTVCVIERSLLERIPAGLPPMLDYRTHIRARSNYNTPPVFGIYVMTLVTRWVRDRVGGVPAMAALNAVKAACLYASLDGLGALVQTHAQPPWRSTMNACFRFADPRLDARFLEESAAAGFSGLGGHRALGGLRASLYNAVPPAAVAQLCEFLVDFAARHG